MEYDLLLVKPSKALEKEIWGYRQEYFDLGETHIHGSGGMARFPAFDEWLEFILAIEKDRLSNLQVHASTFFSVRKADSKIIGSIQLRHSLSPSLAESGGHIGYGIRPSERRKGYGRQQLSLALDVARDRGLSKVMITCNKANTASGKTARSCGGVLTREGMYEGALEQTYWITL